MNPDINENQTPDFNQHSQLENILHLLGDDAVLLPCPTGVKGCRDLGWQSRTVSDMQDPKYISRLATTLNLAVLVGYPSAGLASIDIDNDEDIEPFLVLNPALRQTLRTRGERGCNLWIKFSGDIPPLTPIVTKEGQKWGEFRSDGGSTMIAGTHPSGKTYLREPEVQPVTMEFSEIVWPDNLVLNWQNTHDDHDSSLISNYGPPVFLGSDKAGNPVIRSINEAYFAGLYNEENVILFEPDEQQFYSYDAATGLYCPLTTDIIKKEISSRILEVSRSSDEYAALAKFRTDRILQAIVTQLRGIAECRQAFSMRPDIVHLHNSVMKFPDGEISIHEFSPAFRSRNRSPISYFKEASCPKFMKELLLPAVSVEDAILIQKYAGQCLLGKNLTQRLLVLDGHGGLGKSQICNVIQALVGRANVTQLRTIHLADRFELFRMMRKTLLVGVDVEPDFLSTKGASVIKGLVGGDWFDAEKKGSSRSFEFQGNLNVIITSNSRLRVKLNGDVGAWRRRMLLVRCEGQPPKKTIPYFAERLIEEEGPGILNWALVGLVCLMNDIDQTGSINLSKRQSQLVESLMAESDSLRHFLMNRVELAPCSDLSVDEIVVSYAKYCPDNAWDPLPVTQIHRQLQSLMLELFQKPKSNSIQRHGRACKGFRGVSLKQVS